MTTGVTSRAAIAQPPLAGFVGQVLSALGDAVVQVERCDRHRGMARIQPARVAEVSRQLFAMPEARFQTITGIDARDGIDMLYHWAFDAHGVVITLKALAARPGLAIESVGAFIPAARWIEREIHDLLGASFPGHPDMRRLILDDSWPEGVYPLRKDFDQIKDRPPLPPVPPDPSAQGRED